MTDITHWMPLGFDIRADPSLTAMRSPWDLLLCSNTPCVATIDEEVWPSLVPIDIDKEVIMGLRGVVQGLWLTLEDALEYAKTNAPSTDNMFAVSISLAIEENQEWHLSWDDVSPHISTKPVELSSTWKMLGFDVGDRFLLSLLTNYFNSPDSHSRVLNSEYCNLINSYHLFNTVSSAEQFRISAAKFTTEHAPFFIYRICIHPCNEELLSNLE